MLRISGKRIGPSVLLMLWVCFFVMSFDISVFAQADLGAARTLFLKKQYWQVIQDCGEIIKANPQSPHILAEAHYLMGASYVNLFDFLTAKRSFKAVVDAGRSGAYYEDAYLALGDVELLQENFHEALKLYTEFYLASASKKRLATVYFRLAETNLRLGNAPEYKKYLEKLEKEFPLSFEAADARRLSAHEEFYTVQVGAFTNYDNAEKFVEELKAKGYDVYSVLCMLSGKKLCRIRVGKFRTQKEAEALKKKLEDDGYFAKIFPLEAFGK